MPPKPRKTVHSPAGEGWRRRGGQSGGVSVRRGVDRGEGFPVVYIK